MNGIINFNLDHKAKVDISLCDLNGTSVAEYSLGYLKPGEHNFEPENCRYRAKIVRYIVLIDGKELSNGFVSVY
jgi:hypothetical protein